jgi:hypothetical protein
MRRGALRSWQWVWLLAVACTGGQQPPLGCPVQSLTWVARYQPLEPSGCRVLPGELLGIQSFEAPGQGHVLSMKPDTLTALDDRDTEPSRVPYALGPLPEMADADNMCTVESLSVAEQHAPAQASPPLPESHAVYQWKDVRLIVRPDAPGMQLSAELELILDGCSTRYEVWAMWPGTATCKGAQEEPDDSLCRGSGLIHPDFDTVCDPQLLRCVPARRPPSFRD